MTRRLRSETALLSSFVLLAGALVYLLARPDSAFALGEIAVYPSWTASLPSLLHTLGFALLCAACARDLRQAIGMTLLWGAIEMAAELLQMQPAQAVTGLNLRWTFDAGDLAAIGAGTSLAIVLILTHPDTHKR